MVKQEIMPDGQIRQTEARSLITIGRCLGDPIYQRGIKRGQICDWPDGVGTPDEVAARVTYTQMLEAAPRVEIPVV